MNEKLLSTVLGTTVEYIGETTGNKLHYRETTYNGNLIWCTINIYELAHLCKVWVETQGFNLVSSTSFMGDGQPCCMPVSNDGCEHKWLNGKTEIEAIFKSTNWVLNYLPSKKEIN